MRDLLRRHAIGSLGRTPSATLSRSVPQADVVRRRVSKTVLIGCGLATALLSPVHAQFAPRIVLSTTPIRVAAYDTIYRVSAVPKDVKGKTSGTAKLAWRSNPVLALRFVPRDKYGHTVDVAAEFIGRAFAVVTWSRSDGVIVTDSLTVDVDFPTTREWFVNARDSLGRFFLDVTRIPDWCLYPLKIDKRGQYYDGAPKTVATSDTLWARLLNSSRCPNVATARPDTITFARTR